MERNRQRWLNCQEVTLRVWPADMEKDSSLESACDLFAYDFIPADSLQDAKTIGAL